MSSWYPLLGGGVTAGLIWLLTPDEPDLPSLSAGARPWLESRREAILARRRARQETRERAHRLSTWTKRGAIALGVTLLLWALGAVRMMQILVLAAPIRAWLCGIEHEIEMSQLPDLADAIARVMGTNGSMESALEAGADQATGHLRAALHRAGSARGDGMTDSEAFALMARRCQSLDGRLLALLLARGTRLGSLLADPLARMAMLMRQREAITRVARGRARRLAILGGCLMTVGSWNWQQPWGWGAMVLGGWSWWTGMGHGDV